MNPSLSHLRYHQNNPENSILVAYSVINLNLCSNQNIRKPLADEVNGFLDDTESKTTL